MPAAMPAWVAMARADQVNVLRDPMLLGSSVAALPLGLVVRLGSGRLVEALSPWVERDVTVALVGAFLLVLPAMMFGAMQGFLLLEERDENVLAAVHASPWGIEGLVRWRLGASLGLAVAGGAAGWVVSGLPWRVALLPAMMASALHAPAFAVLLLALARDKVQGFTLWKALSFAAVAPVGWALPAPGPLLAAVFPATWIAWALHPGAGWATAAGLAASGGVLAAVSWFGARGRIG